MFVDYATFNEQWSASGITEEEYERLAPFVDLLVDDWTLGRVGHAVADGAELPDFIVSLYCLTMVNLKANMEANSGGGQKVASFSNGVDSYSFVTDETVLDAVTSNVGWMVDSLPDEWGNRIASHYGVYPHAR